MERCQWRLSINYAVGIYRWLVVFIAALLLTGCASSFNTDTLVPSITMEMKVESTINGLRRAALVHIPRGFEQWKNYPLVVVLHGAFSSAAQIELETGFSTIADHEGFVVLYPEGMGIFGLLQHWNGGHCCGKAAHDGLDDVAFIDECIDTVEKRIDIDSERIFVVGFSNGGMMAYRYAAERSVRIAGIAALAASAGGRVTQTEEWWLPGYPEKPVPLLIMHGTADDVVPLEGRGSPANGEVREYLPLADTITLWLEANRCSWAFRQERLSGGEVEVKRWPDCGDGSEIVVYTLNGWAHRWPGPFFIEKDEKLDGFDAAVEIWEFFQRQMEK